MTRYVQLIPSFLFLQVNDPEDNDRDTVENAKTHSGVSW